MVAMKKGRRRSCHTAHVEEECEMQAQELGRLNARLITAMEDIAAHREQNTAYAKEIGQLTMKVDELTGEVNMLKDNLKGAESNAKMYEEWYRKGEDTGKAWKAHAEEMKKDKTEALRRTENAEHQLAHVTQERERCLGWIDHQRGKHPLETFPDNGNGNARDAFYDLERSMMR